MHASSELAVHQLLLARCSACGNLCCQNACRCCSKKVNSAEPQETGKEGATSINLQKYWEQPLIIFFTLYIFEYTSPVFFSFYEPCLKYMCALCDSEIFTWRAFRFGRLYQHRDMHIPVQVCLRGIVVVIAKLLLLWNNQQKSCTSSTLIILTTTSPQFVSILTLHLLTRACHICCAQLAFHFLSPHNASDEVPFYEFSILDFTEPAQSFSRTVLPNFFFLFLWRLLHITFRNCVFCLLQYFFIFNVDWS